MRIKADDLLLFILFVKEIVIAFCSEPCFANIIIVIIIMIIILYNQMKVDRFALCIPQTESVHSNSLFLIPLVALKILAYEYLMEFPISTYYYYDLHRNAVEEICNIFFTKSAKGKERNIRSLLYLCYLIYFQRFFMFFFWSWWLLMCFSMKWIRLLYLRRR